MKIKLTHWKPKPKNQKIHSENQTDLGQRDLAAQPRPITCGLNIHLWVDEVGPWAALGEVVMALGWRWCLRLGELREMWWRTWLLTLCLFVGPKNLGIGKQRKRKHYINRVLETQFPGGRHVEKMPHQT